MATTPIPPWNARGVLPPNDPLDPTGRSDRSPYLVPLLDVDPATGRVTVDRYVTAHDAGRILHPGMADGQIRGAFAQGLGAALMGPMMPFWPRSVNH